MIYSIKNKVDLKNSEELEDQRLKVKQVRSIEKLGKQGSHYDMKKPYEPIKKAATDTSRKLLEDTKSTTTNINEEMDRSSVHVKALELPNDNGVIHSSLIRLIAKLSVPTNKSKFRLNDDLHSDNWILI